MLFEIQRKTRRGTKQKQSFLFFGIYEILGKRRTQEMLLFFWENLSVQHLCSVFLFILLKTLGEASKKSSIFFHINVCHTEKQTFDDQTTKKKTFFVSFEDV